MAQRGVDNSDFATRTTIAVGLGDVLMLQGVYQEAEAQLACAHALVQDDQVHAAALDGKRGDLAFKQGDVPSARFHLEAAMARLGRFPAARALEWRIVQAGAGVDQRADRPRDVPQVLARW